MCWLLILVHLFKGTIPLLYYWCRYLWGGRNILHQSGRLICLLTVTWGLHTCFTPPIMFLFGLACHDPVQRVVAFPLPVHHPPASMGYRHHASALCTCSFQGLQPNHFTCGLHPSSVDVPVDIHSPSLNFPIFHPREAFLVGHRVTALPSCPCGILLSSPPMEVVLHGVGLVHLSHVWQLPIHKGTPTSDVMRRSQLQWRTCDHPCWFVTS